MRDQRQAQRQDQDHVQDQLEVLIADSDTEARSLFVAALRSRHPEVHLQETGSLSDATKAVEAHRLDCVFLDFHLAKDDALSSFIDAQQKGIATPVVLLVSRGDEKLAEAAIGLGAIDYLLKSDLSSQLLSHCLRSALRFHHTQEQIGRAREELHLRDRAIAAASNGIVICDPHQLGCPVIYCNPAFSAITGYSPKEVIGRNPRFLQGEGTDDQYVQQVRDCLRTETDCQIILRNYRKDGTPWWNELTISPVRDVGGRLTHFIGVQTDITERREAGEALRQNLERQHAVLRDMFASVTEGKLALCGSEEDLPDPLTQFAEPILLSQIGGIRELRRLTLAASVSAEMPEERRFDLETAVGEAAMNAVVHTGAGMGHVFTHERGTVQVRVEDKGQGIAVADLPNATFQEHYPPPLDAWFEVRAYPSSEGLSVFFQNITERVEHESRERFLADLAERARSLTDPDEVIADAVRSVGEFLNVSRCVFADIDIAADTCTVPPDYRAEADVMSMAGTFPISDFGPFLVGEYDAGRTVVAEDVREDPTRFPDEYVGAYEAVGIRAFVAVPVLHSSRLVSVIAAHSATPRQWKPEEVELLKAVVERTWLTVEVTRQQRALTRGAEEQRARAEREALVSRIGQTLLATSDPATVQGRAAALLGEALGADRCYMSSWDALGNRIVVLQDYCSSNLTSVAGEYSARQYAPVMDALFHRGTAVVPDVRSSDLPANVVEMMTGFSLNCVLAVPFFEGDGRITAALMVAKTNAHVWTSEEVLLAETVAALTRTAVEAARLHQREHRIAEQLAQALQPPTPESVPGLELADFYRPAWEDQGVGGDFSDVFSDDKGVTYLVVGDLSGKGLAAASSVAMVRHMLRFALYNGQNVAGPISVLNSTVASHDLLSGFSTLFVGRFDAGTRTLTWVNAGQDAGLILRTSTGHVETLPPTGPILGAISGAVYLEETVTLEAGDVLALYTDGLTEAGPSRTALLTGDGVADLLQGLVGETAPRVIVERLIAEVDAYAGSGMRDDQCLLVGVISKS